MQRIVLGLAVMAGMMVVFQPATAVGATVSYSFSSRIDTPANTGIGVIGESASDVWGIVAPPSNAAGDTLIPTATIDLIAVDGASDSGIDLTHEGFRQHGGAGAANNAPGTLAPWQNSWFMRDLNEPEHKLTFSGFNASEIVSVVMFGVYHNGLDRDTDFTIGATTKTVTGEGSTPTAYSEGPNYVRFDGLTGSTSYVVSVAGNGHDFPDIAGFQLSVVPEPTSFVLMAFAVVAAAGMRRSR